MEDSLCSRNISKSSPRFRGTLQRSHETLQPLHKTSQHRTNLRTFSPNLTTLT